MPFSNMSELIHYQSDWTFLGGHNTNTSHNGDVCQFLVVNSTDVHMWRWVVASFNYSNVVAYNQSVFSTILQSTSAMDDALPHLIDKIEVDLVGVLWFVGVIVNCALRLSH